MLSYSVRSAARRPSMSSAASARVLAGAGLAGVTEIQQLQNALGLFASAMKVTNANPGTTSGALDDRTIAATLAAAFRASDSIPVVKSLVDLVPGEVRSLLTSYYAVAAARQMYPSVVKDITDFINAHASQIASGILVYLAAVNAPPPVAQGGAGPSPVMFTAVAMVPKPKNGQYGKITALIGGEWHVAVPKNGQVSGVSGLGGTWISDFMDSFKARGTHDEIAPQSTAPADATQVSPKEFRRKTVAWYADWHLYAIAGGVAAAATGATVGVTHLVKKRK